MLPAKSLWSVRPFSGHQDQTQLKTKTIGREDSCDLVLEHPTASRIHAHLELIKDGALTVVDADSSNGTFLNRNDDWIRVKKVKLCVGDRIRFGDHEVTLQQLAATLGKHTDIRLGDKNISLRHRKDSAGRVADWEQAGPALQKPRRNPLTGKIEDNS